MDLRLFSSILVGKATKQLIKFKGGGATAAPGLFSLSLDKKALLKLSEPLERTIIVSGTNGKTTTSRIIGDFLRKQGQTYLHNRHGSNLERGLVSTLIENSSLTGELKTRTALFEIDEAALAVVLPKLKSTVIVLTNLSRDQLDRYGEVDNIKRLWESAFSNLKTDVVMVINADDPSLAYLGTKSRCKVVYFGINDKNVRLEQPPHVLDISHCPVCHEELFYHHFYSSHQGDYFCKNCDFKRPELDFSATVINLADSKTEFSIVDKDNQKVNFKIKLEGLYNVYNILAAYSAISSLNIDTNNFAETIEEFSSVFGRGEKMPIADKQILVHLAKNPTGFNELIRTFLTKEGQPILILINDKIADGRDVSWLWDVDFEKLKNKNQMFFVSGTRGTDMGLRLKYAGINDFQLYDDLEESLSTALENTQSKETLTIVATYTALLELKRLLAKKQLSVDFWED